MRKLGIALLALAVVFGLSTGVMADENGELGNEEIDVSITAQEMAAVGVDDTGIEEFDIDLDADGDKTEDLTLEVKSNTDVDMVIEHSYENVDEIFDTDEEDVFWDGTEDNDDWIISPNVVVEEGDVPNVDDFHDLRGRPDEEILVTNFDSAGKYTYDIWFETNVNEDAAFHEFEANDTLKGTVTVTLYDNYN